MNSPYYIKYINNKDILYVFNGATFELFRVENENLLDEYISHLNESNIYTLKKAGSLAKVVLNTSNSCNLKCKYCYADHGVYGRQANLMQIETIDAIIADMSKRNVKQIDIVELFGGEPLLSPYLLYIMDQFSRRWEIHTFLITTNGTIHNNDIISSLKKFPIKFTISLDGPEDINDALRGVGTYKKIMQFIELLHTKDFFNIDISCTFTKKHIEHGYTLNSLASFFKKQQLKFHINSVITTDIDLLYKLEQSEQQLRQDIRQTYTAIANNNHYININPSAYRLLLSILIGIKTFDFCDELKTDYALSYDYNGHLYNCFKLWGKTDFILNPHEKIHKKLEKLNTKNNIIKCQTCWAKYMCGFCIQEVLTGYDQMPYTASCCRIQRTYQICLEELISIVETETMQHILQHFISFME